MPRKMHDLPFHEDGPFVAYRQVTLSGHHLQAGDPVPEDVAKGLPPRRLKQMYDARYVTMASKKDAKTPAPEATPQPGTTVTAAPTRKPKAPKVPKTPKNAKAPQGAKPAAESQGSAAAGAGEGETSPAPAPPATSPDPDAPTGPRIEHKGFGRWYFWDKQGEQSGPMTREEAEARLKATT